MTENLEQWDNHDGQILDVHIIQRTITTEDVCPECEGGLRIAVAVPVSEGEQVFRLECLTCGWVSEALPDPEA